MISNLNFVLVSTFLFRLFPFVTFASFASLVLSSLNLYWNLVFMSYDMITLCLLGWAPNEGDIQTEVMHGLKMG
jgi:hypothetical protein